MRVVFLDRDGVINENRDDHVKSWDEFKFIPGALTALRRLREAGYQCFVVTNQAVVGRGTILPQTLEDIHRRMRAQITYSGGEIQDLRFCPHPPEAGCSCRKPCPGMLKDLAATWGVDLSSAYLIGDAWTDIAAAHAVGVRPILVQTGRGTGQSAHPELIQRPPIHIAANLLDAVTWLMSNEAAPALRDEPRPMAYYAGAAPTGVAAGE